jgi:hypothetical protein
MHGTGTSFWFFIFYNFSVDPMTGVKTVTNTNFSHVDLQQFWASLSIVEGLMCPIKTFVCVKFRRDCAAAAVLTLLVFVCWQGADLRLRGVDLRIAAHPSEDYAPSSLVTPLVL